MKKFWDSNFQNQDYDPVARRKGTGSLGGFAGTAGGSKSNLTPVKKPVAATTGGVKKSTAVTASKENIVPATRRAKISGSTEDKTLTLENEQLRSTIGNLENAKKSAEVDRDFYFAKLRDIEILLQDHESDVEKHELLKSIQTILYDNGAGASAAAATETAMDDSTTF